MHAWPKTLILAQDSLGSRTLTSLTLMVLLAPQAEIMQQVHVAEVPTNDFGVLVMPTNRREARDADSKELGSEEEKTALLLLAAQPRSRRPEYYLR